MLCFDNLLPADERPLYTDTLSVRGYILAVTACKWRNSLFEKPHFRVQVKRANGTTVWVDTLPPGTSPSDAIAIGLMQLRANAALDVWQIGWAI